MSPLLAFKLVLVVLFWCAVCLITMPVVPTVLYIVLGGRSSINRDCFYHDIVIDCSAKDSQTNIISDVVTNTLDIITYPFQTVECECIVNYSCKCYKRTSTVNKYEVFVASGNYMTRFAASGVFFPHLRILNISKNLISSVNLTHLPNLHTLDISFNKLKTISWSSVSARNIVEVNLSHNLLTHIRKEDFFYATKLKRMNISFNRISFLRNVVIEKNIESLDLSGNPLYNINNGIYRLPSTIKYLNLSKSKIFKISEHAFSNLVCLELLDLSHNEMYQFPQVFDYAASLKHLDLSYNSFNVIKIHHKNSMEIFESCDGQKSKFNVPLRNLQTLNLSNNKIVGIKSDTFSKLENLQTLDISHNALSYIMSDATSALKELETLDISYNELTTLAAGTFEANKNLVRLYLSHNLLLSLDEDAFRGLTCLEELDASWNFIATLPEKILYPASRLRRLDMSVNVLRNLPSSVFQGNPTLRHLNVSQNNLHHFSQELLDNCQVQIFLDGNDVASTRHCSERNYLYNFGSLELALYWPISLLPPIWWALLLVVSVICIVKMDWKHVRQIPVTIGLHVEQRPYLNLQVDFT